MRHFVFRWIVTTFAVMIAAWLVRGIAVDGTGASIGAALLLGIFNGFIRPVLLLLSAPLVVLTMGLFIFVINALPRVEDDQRVSSGSTTRPSTRFSCA